MPCAVAVDRSVSPVSQGCGWPTGQCVHVLAQQLCVVQYMGGFGTRLIGHGHMHTSSWILSQATSFLSFSLLILSLSKLSLNSQQYRGRGHKAPNVILCVDFVRPLGTLQKDGPKNGPQGTRENNKDINVSLVI